MGKYVDVLRIGKLCLVKKKATCYEKRRTFIADGDLTDEEIREKRKEGLRKRIAHNKRMKVTRESLFRKLNRDTSQSDIQWHKRTYRDSNACMTFLGYFWNVSNLAKEHARHISYGVFKRQMKIDDMPRLWKSIRGWLGKNTSNSIFVCTLGCRKKGVVVLRFLFVAEELEDNSFDYAASLGIYLKSKKGFSPELFLAGERASDIIEHYTQDVETIEDIIYYYGEELSEVFMASLKIPLGTSITFRNGKATEAVKDRYIEAGDSIAGVVNSNHYFYANSIPAFSLSGQCLCTINKKTKKGKITDVTKALTAEEWKVLQEHDPLDFEDYEIDDNEEF